LSLVLYWRADRPCYIRGLLVTPDPQRINEEVRELRRRFKKIGEVVISISGSVYEREREMGVGGRAHVGK
jgi:hypothetical protein